ncbi:uncharacterized protein LOC111707443 [Eurytemora carolleeae]|uniref:uncharacterized protein LOC111707443 n=1 Tax=Eurytemora carolleeae TaxID=1294199 RepID=UPI000C77CF97|nr:uncharacterized protein LOC111707443 [Eurytemora carolleeae]|eukprot:XP_023336323.1 uncharacterized protein LOC111707443 [Eurytemora affinis]
MWDGDDKKFSEEYEDDFDYSEGAGGEGVPEKDVIQKQIVKIKNTVNVAVNNYVNTMNAMKEELLAKDEGVMTEGVQEVITGSRMKERLATKLQEAVTEGVQVMKNSMEYVNGTTISEIDKQMVNIIGDSKNATFAVHEHLCENKEEGTSVNVQIVLIIGGIVIGVVMSIMVYFCAKYLRRGGKMAGPEAVWRKEQGCLRSCVGDMKVCSKLE